MYGFRALIGLIVPSVNTTIEPEFNAMKPEGVSVHVTRLLYRSGSSLAGLERMAQGTEEAAELLATAGVNIIAYACTIGSLVKGIGWDQELINRIEMISGIPATTTTTSIIQAFRAFGVKRVAIATPYGKQLNEAEREFFEAHGIKVVRMKGLDMDREDMHQASAETTYELACQVDTREADAVFISCTNFKSITVIDRLEKRLHKLVFSSNTATMWNVMKRLGLGEQIKGYGKLFEY